MGERGQVREMPLWVPNSVRCPHSVPSPPAGWANSRRLRSVSRRASVRSRWLMSAVSTGGHEGREAGLSESWARRGGVTSEWRESPGLPNPEP